VGDQLALLKKAGFLAIEHCGGSGFATSAYTLAAEFKAIAGE
jgi:hypothetical protein